MMSRQHLCRIAVVVAFFLTAPFTPAATLSIPIQIHAMFGGPKVHAVKFNLRNDTAAAIEVKIGDQVVTLSPGKPVSFSLPVGTQIIANSTTPNHSTGSIITTVVKEYDGATVAIH
jgi:hypothetical protein